MKIVCVTACISGIAHTYLSAEALEEAAKAEGHEIRVETRGSVGTENELTPAEIAAADVVIVAADMGVPKERFNGKAMLEVGTHKVVQEAPKIIAQATEIAKNHVPGETLVAAEAVGAAQPEAPATDGKKNSLVSELYKHIMSGVSFMIPFVVSGGIITALSYAFGNVTAEWAVALGESLGIIGSAAFGMMVPIMSAYVAFSIADRPGLVPGMVAGLMAVNNTSSGFLGGMLGGLLAGYTVLLLKKIFNFKGGMKAMLPILILPGISALSTGLIMLYLIGTPIGWLNDILTNWLVSLSGSSAILLCAIVAGMITVDLGGVFCRVGYAFAVATLATGEPSVVMAAAMAGGLVPSTAMALCTVIAPQKFTQDEIEAGKGCWVLGASFIVEGAIPFAARDIKAIIPSLTLGSAVTGALCAVFNCTQSVPHGGIWVAPIPGAIGNLPMYLLATVIGIAVAAGLVLVLKKDLRPKTAKAKAKAQK